MLLFKVPTRINTFDTFKSFSDQFHLGKEDLVITNQYLFDLFMSSLQLTARFIMQERYGPGEPSDEMINSILKDINGASFRRVIAVGGGTIIDIAKILVLKDIQSALEAFDRNVTLVRDKSLVIVPTTCGTGSEVTPVAIAEIKSRSTKMGLVDDALFPDDAALIPELLRGLPYPFFIYGAIDALIHAMESHVSPNSNLYARLFSRQALDLILDVFQDIELSGPERRFAHLEAMLTAANLAGIAFGNTGVGAVHALSYPVGGVYHVPHGEANYLFLTAVFRRYTQINPDGGIRSLNTFLAGKLSCPHVNVYDRLDDLLEALIHRRKLSDCGMQVEDIDNFTDTVLERQGRLLANNYTELSRDDIRDIYRSLF